MIDSGTDTTAGCKPCVEGGEEEGGADKTEDETEITCTDLDKLFGADVSLLFKVSFWDSNGLLTTDYFSSHRLLKIIARHWRTALQSAVLTQLVEVNTHNS